MILPWKQLALACADAQTRLDVSGYLRALAALEHAAAAARLELLAALNPPPKPEPKPEPPVPPPPSRWQETADEWGTPLLVLRTMYSHVSDVVPCIEYVVALSDANDWEKRNALERVEPRGMT